MSNSSLTAHWHRLDRNTVLELQGRRLHRYLRDCVLPFSGHYQRLFGMLGLAAHDFHSGNDLDGR